jgi:hypothetical protein
MGSSPGFGSAPRDSRPFGLAFAPAPPVPGLTSPRTATRRLILQKARRHPTRQRGEAPTGRKRTVSGALSLPLNGVLFTVPSRYWFPIGRCWYLALGRGRPCFPPAFTWRAVLTLRSHAADPSVTYGALTHLRRPVPAVFGCQDQLISARRLPPPPDRASNPTRTSPAGCAALMVWAPPRSLAATRGILSLPRGTEMFQFPRCPPAPESTGEWVSPHPGCPIRKPLDPRLPAPPQSISPRGRVLPRPTAPRHPPCAHLR